jgi:hypothetical protein
MCGFTLLLLLLLHHASTQLHDYSCPLPCLCRTDY